MWWTNVVVVVLILVTTVHSTEDVNNRPIIGIYAQPASKHGEYIAASYVKWIESAGGRVIPIPYNTSESQLNHLFQRMNGLLFPGGDSDIIENAQYLYELAIQANDRGDYFPVFGTCMGFEWLLQMTSKNWQVLDIGFDAMNLSLPLNFTSAAGSSRLFQNAPEMIRQTFQYQAMTLNNHQKGIRPMDFMAHPILSDFFHVLATNYDRQQIPFVSMIEAKKYPVFGVQFHPEKNMFENGFNPDGTAYEAIDHSLKAIQASQYLANFFVQETRRSMHRFDSSTEERARLIYNYQTFMTTWPEFVESYIFTTF